MRDTVANRLVHREDGFTLTEVLVSMMLMIVVMFALYSIFDMSLRVFSFGNDKTEAVENARLGLERMERELRAAYPHDRSTQPPAVFLSPTNTSQISFGNDRNGNHMVDSGETITYALNDSTLERNGQPTVEYVSGLNFRYENRSGVETTPPEAYRVRITLSTRVDRGISDAATQTLVTTAVLKNRAG